MSNHFDNEMIEWGLSPKDYSVKDRILIGTNLMIVKRLDVITAILRSKQQYRKNEDDE